ncbi:MAG TPA: hypothetical protein VF245_02005 [Solirubrobacterales bacterium]
MRRAEAGDVPAVLALWERERSGHLRDRGARRVTALVAFEDERAGGFWEAVGYPRDREIGRRVRNL